MEMQSLIYVSTSSIASDNSEYEVEQIVATSNYNNPSIEITGTLLFTGSHFAQVIEGHASDIDDLFQTVSKDPRHRDVMVMDRCPIVARRFPDWSMAYSGPSPFVAGFVTRLLNAPSQLEYRDATKWLTDLMSAFARK